MEGDPHGSPAILNGIIHSENDVCTHVSPERPSPLSPPALGDATPTAPPLHALPAESPNQTASPLMSPPKSSPREALRSPIAEPRARRGPKLREGTFLQTRIFRWVQGQGKSKVCVA